MLNLIISKYLEHVSLEQPGGGVLAAAHGEERCLPASQRCRMGSGMLQDLADCPCPCQKSLLQLRDSFGTQSCSRHRQHRRGWQSCCPTSVNHHKGGSRGCLFFSPKGKLTICFLVSTPAQSIKMNKVGLKMIYQVRRAASK